MQAHKIASLVVSSASCLNIVLSSIDHHLPERDLSHTKRLHVFVKASS